MSQWGIILAHNTPGPCTSKKHGEAKCFVSVLFTSDSNNEREDLEGIYKYLAGFIYLVVDL